MAGRNFGRDAHKATRKAAAVALADAEAEIAWEPPPEADWEQEVPSKYHLQKRSRLISRIAYYRGKIVDYAVMHEILIDGEWAQVYRVDCDHGMVHRHTGLPSRNEQRDLVRKIKSQDDIHDTFDDEYRHAMDTCSRRETRWIA